MRFLLPLLAAVAAALSILVDFYPPPVESAACMRGGCRTDLIVDQVQRNGANAESAKAMLLQDASNPNSWCAYGEYLAFTGQTEQAAAAFDRALELGSGLSAVRMRATNFDFTHGRIQEALRHVPIILSQTGDFDDVLFFYVQRFASPQDKLLGGLIPNDRRVAHAWLEWSRSRSSTDQFVETWKWMRENNLEDETSRMRAVQALWDLKRLPEARTAWMELAKNSSGEEKVRQLLTNPAFEQEPIRVPFDWHWEQVPSVQFRREDGLDIRFLGESNLELATLNQAAFVDPGSYRFEIEFSADDLSTDQGPFFRITNAEDAKRVLIETQPVLGTVKRQGSSTEFRVPQGTRAILVQLVRRQSERISNRIKGSLHLYRVGLTRLGE
ncbi:MAG: hypothetical protein ABL995_18940 [Bryobacteraceae bacterium]